MAATSVAATSVVATSVVARLTCPHHISALLEMFFFKQMSTVDLVFLQPMIDNFLTQSQGLIEKCNCGVILHLTTLLFPAVIRFPVYESLAKSQVLPILRYMTLAICNHGMVKPILLF